MKLTLQNKLALGILIPVSIAFIIAVVALFSARNIRENFFQLSQEILPVSLTLQELAYRGSRINSSLNELITDKVLEADGEGGTREFDEIEENVESLAERLEIYQALLEELGLSGSAEFTRVIEIGEELLNLGRSLNIDAELSIETLTELREELEDIEQAFVAQTERLIAVEAGNLDRSENNVSSAIDTASQLTLILLIITGFVVVFVMRRFSREVINPIKTLSDTALKLKSGDFTARSAVQSSDELGEFAAAFNDMAETIQKKIDEVNAARLEAERSSQVKSAFLASMSHELRTPLNAILNFTRFVVDGDLGELNDQQRDILNEVLGSGKHLLNLINDVLDMSKIESGSLNLFVEQNVDVKTLLEKAISIGEGLLEGKPIRIVADIQPDLPKMYGDKKRVLQIFLNIISNACKFTDEGEITVRAFQQNGEIMVSIKDTGIGIAPEDQSLIFEPFKQTTSGLRQAGGTGLGMPIAKSLAEAHGGRIWLESEYGVGTTFYIALPVKSDMLVNAMAS
jgi:signal transduction histidine kinase